mmetsp:Transcript_41706/g.65112  ORF Transcript_41706/g.65112 Transcript_41706/m.65112 type:complete len:83 (-) Transcript_41706:458-706(-)
MSGATSAQSNVLLLTHTKAYFLQLLNIEPNHTNERMPSVPLPDPVPHQDSSSFLRQAGNPDFLRLHPANMGRLLSILAPPFA